MSATVALDAPGGAVGASTNRRELVVAWQHPHERSFHPVGLLRAENGEYTFRYVEAVRTAPDFAPLLGFERLDEEYRSERLFPIFAQRAMDPRRADYTRYVESLGLDPASATPWEQIARSRGRRQGDTLQLFPVPRVESGTVTCPFLVHGIRHMPANQPEIRGRVRHVTRSELDDVIDGLRPGDGLRLEPEPTNRANAEAVVVVAGDTPLGYVPNLLVRDLHRLMKISPVHASVVRANGPDAPGHLRLLAEIRAEGARGFRFFQDECWRPLA